jgi:hypothetical protein
MAIPLGNIKLDEAAVYELTHDPAGPVGQLINELSERGVTVARGAAHVWPGTRKSTIWKPETSSAVLPSGTTRDSIEVHPAQIGSRGGIFGGGDVNLIPTIFLEPVLRRKSVQMDSRYPFMTTGLESLEL